MEAVVLVMSSGCKVSYIGPKTSHCYICHGGRDGRRMTRRSPAATTAVVHASMASKAAVYAAIQAGRLRAGMFGFRRNQTGQQVRRDDGTPAEMMAVWTTDCWGRTKRYVFRGQAMGEGVQHGQVQGLMRLPSVALMAALHRLSLRVLGKGMAQRNPGRWKVV